MEMSHATFAKPRASEMSNLPVSARNNSETESKRTEGEKKVEGKLVMETFKK